MPVYYKAQKDRTEGFSRLASALIELIMPTAAKTPTNPNAIDDPFTSLALLDVWQGLKSLYRIDLGHTMKATLLLSSSLFLAIPNKLLWHFQKPNFL